MMKKSAALFVAVVVLVSGVLSGCDQVQKPSEATPGDAVSSAEEIVRTEAAQAVEIRIDGVKNDEIFVMQYNWYGEEFVSKDSLNKTMMKNYVSEGNHAPYAVNKAALSLAFDTPEGVPSAITLTQYANTVRASSALPFDVLEQELTRENDGSYSIVIDFRSYKMYYYLLKCEWENGNSSQYAFAVEKAE